MRESSNRQLILFPIPLLPQCGQKLLPALVEPSALTFQVIAVQPQTAPIPVIVEDESNHGALSRTVELDVNESRTNDWIDDRLASGVQVL